MARKAKVELRSLTENTKKQNSALKQEVRSYIRALHPRSKKASAQPIKAYPKDAIKFYEDKGYMAPMWLLRLTGDVARYGQRTIASA
jgi:hypothetical protein